jgi:predicted house-cleaning noncanonical NTP pyrophosphatase (MazG superfamily)
LSSLEKHVTLELENISNKEGKCKMKEQIITEIAEILQSYSEERLKLIVRLVTVLATATDRTAGLSEKAVLSIARHAK